MPPVGLLRCGRALPDADGAPHFPVEFPNLAEWIGHDGQPGRGPPVPAGDDRALQPAQPHRHGAADPQPHRQRHRRADRDECRILRPARQRRPDRRGGDPDLAAGQGLCLYPRHPQRRTGGRLEAGDRRRPCQGRAHLPAAVACRPHLPPRPAAGRRPAGGAVGGQAGDEGLHRRRLQGHPDPTGARRVGTAGDRRGLPPRHPQRAGRRLRHGRGACRQRLSDRPVPARRHQQAHRRLWRLRRESRPLPVRGSGRRGGGGRGRPCRHPPVAAEPGQRRPGKRSGRHLQPGDPPPERLRPCLSAHDRGRDPWSAPRIRRRSRRTARALHGPLHGQQRDGERSCRHDRLRPALHRQPRSGGAAAHRCPAGRTGPEDLLWRRPLRLHRLPHVDAVGRLILRRTARVHKRPESRRRSRYSGADRGGWSGTSVPLSSGRRAGGGEA
ncbi:hypothetical protein Lal_00005073 [Lupinus albus]|nr:hypothetical protein Lal_00005073 [Lupinus albus]